MGNGCKSTLKSFLIGLLSKEFVWVLTRFFENRAEER
jgi:hypothetical protein